MRSRPATRRAARLLGEARARGRSGLRGRIDDLLVVWPAVMQTALAAVAAWAVARYAVGHANPFFAPVAAIVTLGVTYGQRVVRAAEIALGVAIGVLLSELVVLWLGRSAVVLGVVVALAMLVAILLGGRRLAVTQAASSAALVATIATPTSGITLTRFVDALCGGGMALFFGLVLLPIDPVGLARRARPAVLAGLAEVLDDVRTALRADDHDVAVTALVRARGLDALAAQHAEAAEVGMEIARASPLRRRAREAIRREVDAAVGLDLAVRGTRVLARGTLRAVDTDAHVPELVHDALGKLIHAVELLGPALDDPGVRTEPARQAAFAAAATATAALELTINLSLSAIVSQVRTIATDLLRVTGEDEGDAMRAVRRAASAG